MAKKNPAPASLRAKLLLLSGALGFCLVLLLAGELACRLFTDIPFLGTSRDLFAAGVWGDSTGNAPNSSAVTFGVRVFTDRYGFRIPPGGAGAGADDRDALLILGDSVAFGAGVEEPQTLAGLLGKARPTTRVYNAAVIGHETHDYRNVARHFLPTHDAVQAVVLIFCLNDVNRISAQEIDAALHGDRRAGDMPRSGPLRWINDRLRSRSKLYLLLKNRLTRRQYGIWLRDSAAYALPDAPIEERLRPIDDIAQDLAADAVPFLVVLSPYEFQLRSQDSGIDHPQRRISAFLEQQGIEFVDALPTFRRDGGKSRSYFLPDDPMHLSARGHRVLAELILEWLASLDDRDPSVE